MTLNSDYLAESFSPAAAHDARVLILGTMPGVKSLEMQQYYAHPRNYFWSFMEELFDAGADKPYEKRLNILKENHIALWDIFHSCIRPGSLDSAIRNEQPNDIPALLEQHRYITHIYTNGKKAYQALYKYFGSEIESYNVVSLPSTSPANASIPLKKKKKAWSQIRWALD